MIRRIGLLHTVVFLAEKFRELFQRELPALETFHMIDEAMLQELMAHGHLTPAITRRIATHARLAEEAGADLIVFTCSSTSPAVDRVRDLVDVPIMKIDDPMAKKAVQVGRRIGVVTTAKTTEGPSVDLIRAWAENEKKKVEVNSILVSEAFEARLRGDIEAHDRLVRGVIARMTQDNDVVVLAQASMAHLAEPDGQNGTPVLASPKICLDAIKDMVKTQP